MMLYLLLMSPEVKWPGSVCMADAKIVLFPLSWENHPFGYCALASVLAATGNTSAGSLF